jgi:tetratricopeptide (TPR) repeat protein
MKTMLDQRNKLMIAASTILALALGACFSDTLAKPAKIDWDKKLAKGYRFLDFGDYDAALKFFQSEVDHHPESGAVRMGLGLVCKRKGKPAEAIAHLRRATEVEPDYAEPYYELGAMLEIEKNYSEACKCFERYLQLAPLSSKRASVEDRIRNCKQNM